MLVPEPFSPIPAALVTVVGRGEMFGSIEGRLLRDDQKGLLTFLA